MDSDELLDHRILKVREKIRKNFPSSTSSLVWRKASENRIVSTCGRFAIDRFGSGDAVRFNARMLPMTVIGHRLTTAAQAKEVCDRHVSALVLPLPLSSGTSAPVVAATASSSSGGAPEEALASQSMTPAAEPLAPALPSATGATVVEFLDDGAAKRPAWDRGNGEVRFEDLEDLKLQHELIQDEEAFERILGRIKT